MKKNIIIILSIILSIVLFEGLFLGTASAALSTNDCEMASNYKINGTGYWELKYGNIYPYENFVIASKHLLSYCCKQKYWGDDPQKYCTGLTENYPESDFYFDHLIDVGFRSLDAVGIYDGQIADPAAVERNNLITDPVSATTPTIIETKYIKNWTIGYPFLEHSGDIKKYNQDALQLTLADKYINLCYFISEIYSGGGLTKNITWRTNNSKRYYNNCMLIARYRINQETKLAKLLMAQKSIKTLADSVKAYAIDEFVQNRLMKLFDKLSDISELFKTITKQASLTEKCSK